MFLRNPVVMTAVVLVEFFLSGAKADDRRLENWSPGLEPCVCHATLLQHRLAGRRHLTDGALIFVSVPPDSSSVRLDQPEVADTATSPPQIPRTINPATDLDLFLSEAGTILIQVGWYSFWNAFVAGSR